MKRATLIKFCMFALFVVAAVVIHAQTTPPPPARGHETDQPAPLGSGLAVLATLMMAYGATKLYRARRKKS